MHAGLQGVSRLGVACWSSACPKQIQILGILACSAGPHVLLQDTYTPPNVPPVCRKRMNRKRARMRAKRMVGQGLNPATGLPFRQHDPYKDPNALVNPWEDTRQQRGRPDSPDRYGCTTAYK